MKLDGIITIIDNFNSISEGISNVVVVLVSLGLFFKNTLMLTQPDKMLC